MRTCPICLASGGRARYRVRGHEIVACPRCTGWYLAERAAEVAYDGDYLRRGESGEACAGYFDYEADRPLRRRNFARNLEILGEFAAAGSLCDVGCASGHFLEVARASGRFSAVAGVDVSEPAVAAVRARLGCPAWSGRVEALTPPDRFDALTMWETIEHIPQPVEALVALRGWLRPGGLLAVGTGDNASPLARLLGRRWWYITPPDHCVYFNRRALATALARAGFRVVGWRRIQMHWVSAADVAMKALRSFDVAPTRALAAAGWVRGVRLPIVHGTTLVALARPA